MNGEHGLLLSLLLMTPVRVLIQLPSVETAPFRTVAAADTVATPSSMEVTRDEDPRRRCLRGGETPGHRGGGAFRPAARRGPGGAESDRRLSHRRVHPLRRRSGGAIPGYPRARGGRH